MFDEKMTFIKHIDFVISKAYCRLGFLMRVYYEFHDFRVLKVLYFARVGRVVATL